MSLLSGRVCRDEELLGSQLLKSQESLSFSEPSSPFMEPKDRFPTSKPHSYLLWAIWIRYKHLHSVSKSLTYILILSCYLDYCLFLALAPFLQLFLITCLYFSYLIRATSLSHRMWPIFYSTICWRGRIMNLLKQQFSSILLFLTLF
jgi:hypothetical protein